MTGWLLPVVLLHQAPPAELLQRLAAHDARLEAMQERAVVTQHVHTVELASDGAVLHDSDTDVELTRRGGKPKSTVRTATRDEAGWCVTG